MELLRAVFEEFDKAFKASPSEIERTLDTPLDVVEAMWQVKWGDEWVPTEEFYHDRFWSASLMRLANAEKIESHRIVTAPDGNSGLVYRLKK
jgi:hypothetical protein